RSGIVPRGIAATAAVAAGQGEGDDEEKRVHRRERITQSAEEVAATTKSPAVSVAAGPVGRVRGRSTKCGRAPLSSWPYATSAVTAARLVPLQPHACKRSTNDGASPEASGAAGQA